MTTHNTGKIKWSVLLDSIQYIDDKSSGKYFKLINKGGLEHVAKEMYNVINEFSQTIQKKPSKNPLLTKYNNAQL